MTIVASNNITVSNVNDGTITHYAYAYSADGTDRFTTVYPNLNLGDNTKTFVGAEGVANNLTGSIRINPLTQKTQVGDFYYLTSKATIDNHDWFRLFLIPDTATPNMTKVAVKPNTKYTFSFFAKGTGQHTIYAYKNWTAPNTPWILQVNLTSDWKLYTFTVTSNAVIPVANVQFFIRSNNGTEINLKYPKVEEGPTATPYMPSATEVTAADWPSYIGQYTNFTQADSTNPSDYTWSLMRGDDGKDGTDGTSGIIVSSVAPDSPQTGQLWQDTSTIPQLVKKWTGTSWVIWAFYAQNLIADNISTISLNLGDMTGGTVKLMADVAVNGTPKKHGLYQSKLGLLSSGPSLATPSTLSNSQMGVANLNKGELRFMVTDYTEDLKAVQEAGMSDQNNAFIKFDSYDNGKDVMVIGSSGDIVFKGNTLQDTPWITLSSGVKYKYMFSRVYISFAITGNGAQYMQFGFLPANLRPTAEQFLVLAAWSNGTSGNRHVNIRPSDGAVILWNPENGLKYYSEVSYTL